MYKILIVTDSLKNKNHPRIGEKLRQALDEDEVIVFDMNCCMQQHEKYYTIKGMKPDIIITLDLAGFEMVNIMDVLSYNSLGCRMAHLIFDKAYKYSEELAHLQNLSMFTYVMGTESLDDIREEYPLVPNVLSHDLGNGVTDEGRYREWFESFIRDARL